MNSRQKGRKAELKCKAALEAEGWQVEIVKGGYGWQKSTDFWGCWDILAFKKGSPFLRVIQVKATKGKANPVGKSERVRLAAFCGPTDPFQKEVWVYHDRQKEPVILLLTSVQAAAKRPPKPLCP